MQTPGQRLWAEAAAKAKLGLESEVQRAAVQRWKPKGRGGWESGVRGAVALCWRLCSKFLPRKGTGLAERGSAETPLGAEMGMNLRDPEESRTLRQGPLQGCWGVG